MAPRLRTLATLKENLNLFTDIRTRQFTTALKDLTLSSGLLEHLDSHIQSPQHTHYTHTQLKIRSYKHK